MPRFGVQLWTRLTLGFSATALAVVGVYGWHQLGSESTDLRTAATRELRLVGATVQGAVATAARDGKPEDVRRLVETLRSRDASLDVLVYEPDGRVSARSWGSAPDEVVGAFARESAAGGRSAVLFDPPADPRRLLGAFPVPGPDGQQVALVVLVRALDELRRDLAAERRDIVLSAAALVLGLGLSAWFLAGVYVRRPLDDLVRAMRAVRAGDLATKARFGRADEVGAAAGEFNLMTTELVDARRRLIEEAAAREALEGRLQHTDKLITVGQLSAGLAHEIGSPLQVLNGRARALASRSDLPPDVVRSAGIVAAESDRIAGIVAQLVTFSRQSRPAMQHAPIDAPVRTIVELLEPEARRHGVRLEFVAGEALPGAHVDIGQVQQVVMNLLTNAIRATPEGGRVRVTLEASSFTAAAGPLASVALSVDDTGAGIPEAQLPRIFDPFFTTRLHAGGTGLGLAVVKSIVDAHGGAIEVETAVGRGTRFTVHLPLDAPAGVRS